MQKKKALAAQSKREKEERRLRDGPPPLVNAGATSGMILRYRLATEASAASVYVNCLGKLMAIAITGTALQRTYDSIRLNKIRVWAPPQVTTSATGYLGVPVQVRLDDGVLPPYGSERLYSQSPTGEKGVYMSIKFQGVQISWLDAGTCDTITGQRLFSMTGPAGTIVDLHCAVRWRGVKSLAVNSLASTALSTGAVYYNYLDNTDTAGSGNGTQILACLNWGGGPTTKAYI